MGLRVLKECSQVNKHACNVSALSRKDDQIVSGSDDGIMKLWTPHLELIKEVDTMKGGIISLAITSEAIYTCGSDQTIQAWDRNSIQNVGQVQTISLCAPQKIFADKANSLWAGDSHGKVAKFNNMKESEVYDLIEEVWDIHVETEPEPLVFTARDRDIAISGIISGNLRKNAVIKATLQGCSPMAIIGNYFCCMNRDGKLIQVFENKVESKFKHLRDITASQLIVNALCPSGSSDAAAYAGGYDSNVSLWDLNSASCQGTVHVSSCVNVLQSARSGAYAATTDGRIILVGP